MHQNVIESLKAREKTIDGYTISVTPFPAWIAWRLKRNLVGLIGTTLIKALQNLSTKSTGKGKSKKSEYDFDLVAVGNAIEDLFDKLTEDEFEILTKRIIASTRVDNKDISNDNIFNELFAANLHVVYKILLYVLEVNYGSFLDLNGFGAVLKEKINTAMKSVNT